MWFEGGGPTEKPVRKTRWVAARAYIQPLTGVENCY